ncbi:MAG: VanW family protein, partial [Cyanobacteria bacterium J06649_4]
NKIINITRGAALLNKSRIRPHHNWSFWHRLHRPDAANGFVAGRNLVNGKLVAQTGGGLCQLSSMAYHLALTAGLTVIERHAHSIDIYEEYDRYTPLGADATVVWGVKDLRLFNPYPFAVSFSFAVQDGELVGEIQGKHPLTPQQVEFIREPLEDPFIKVETHINQQLQTTTIYEQQQGLKAVSASAS